MEIKLIVIRTRDQEKLSVFYSQLGLQFDYHKHGNSPYHYSTTIGQTVVELYPLAKNQVMPDAFLRLGFGIENFDETVSLLRHNQVTFLSEPAETDFGWMAVIEDPEGRKIELYKS
jgi:predicted enzyme related to lactoylglutathione lyase